MTRDAIATDKLPAPIGPFSLGVRGVGLLFLSGQVAQDPATGKLIDGYVASQTPPDPGQHRDGSGDRRQISKRRASRRRLLD